MFKTAAIAFCLALSKLATRHVASAEEFVVEEPSLRSQARMLAPTHSQIDADRSYEAIGDTGVDAGRLAELIRPLLGEKVVSIDRAEDATAQVSIDIDEVLGELEETGGSAARTCKDSSACTAADFRSESRCSPNEHSTSEMVLS